MVKLQKNVISSATFIRLLLTLISVSSFFKRNPWKLKHSQDSKNFVIKIYVDVWYTGCITVFLVFDVIMIQEIGSAVTSLCWPNLLLMAVADRGTILSYYLDMYLARPPAWSWLLAVVRTEDRSNVPAESDYAEISTARPVNDVWQGMDSPC